MTPASIGTAQASSRSYSGSTLSVTPRAASDAPGSVAAGCSVPVRTRSQSGTIWNAGSSPAISRRGRPPVAGITNSRRLSFCRRSETNTSCLPSGEYAGNASSAGVLVIRFTSEPSARIVQMSRSPFSTRSESNAIRVPSGDQFGFSLKFGVEVSCVLPEPSAFITQTSRVRWSVDSTVYAIRLPSGDQDGSCSFSGPFVSCFGLRPRESTE